MSTTIQDIEKGTSSCCGAPILEGFCKACKEHVEYCDLCGGSGEVEKIEYERSDATGYNTVEHGTGIFSPCPECRPGGGDTDMDDDS
jgi:hypothetical protein